MQEVDPTVSTRKIRKLPKVSRFSILPTYDAQYHTSIKFDPILELICLDLPLVRYLVHTNSVDVKLFFNPTDDSQPTRYGVYFIIGFSSVA